jgi:hypothetical protein
VRHADPALRHPARRPRRGRDGRGAGIGRGIAAGLAAFGAKVAIWERNAETCAAAAAEIGALGVTTDVRDAAEVDAGARAHGRGARHRDDPRQQRGRRVRLTAA